MTYDTKDIRNIVLIGHGGSGKTTLTEAMLFCGHEIPVMGTVENGKTVSDFNEQEIEKKMSIHASVCYTEWNNVLINFIDTPGAPDFVGEVIAGIQATDSAVFVINGEQGVEMEVIKNWRKCNSPKLVFINKMHKDNADFEKCMAHLKENFKDKTFIPITLPIGAGKSFKGVVDLIDKEARYFENDGKTIRREKAPGDIKGLDEYFKQMLETAVESEDRKSVV
jgi:elongation factor G